MSQIPERVVVIDGGFSTQLAFHVGSNIDGDPLWSARFNAVEPAAVVQVRAHVYRLLLYRLLYLN